MRWRRVSDTAAGGARPTRLLLLTPLLPTAGELARLFPTEIANDPKWPATASQGPSGQAKLLKYAVVKTPRSVYAAIPGRNKYRPSQESPIPGFTMAGDWSAQKFLGSMEGAVFAGKLAAEVIADRAAGQPTKQQRDGEKKIQPDIVAAAAAHTVKAPLGVKGDTPIAFGGGMTLNPKSRGELQEQDPVQLAGSTEEAEAAPPAPAAPEPEPVAA